VISSPNLLMCAQKGSDIGEHARCTKVFTAMDEKDDISIRPVSLLGPAALVVALEGTLLMQARPTLVRSVCFKNDNRTAKTLASMMGAGAALEFGFGPVFGKLSDAFGRKPVLLSTLFGTAACRMLVFMQPKSKKMLFLDRAVSMALVTSFFATIRGMQVDVLSSREGLALEAGRIARYAGLGMLIGPYLEAFVTRVGNGDSRFVFLVSALLLTSLGLVLKKEVKETLKEEKRKPFETVKCNPFSFVSLLGSNKTAAALMGVILLQSFGDARNMQEVNSIFMRQHLKWGKVKTANMIAAFGATVMIGAFFVKKSIKTFGLRGHTSVSNGAQVLSAILWGLAPAEAPMDTVLTYLSLFISLGSQRKRDAVESIATRILVHDEKIGAGEVAAGLSNWRSLSAILAPLLFGNLFAFATEKPDERYMPGAPFFALAGLTLAAETMLRNLKDEDMFTPDLLRVVKKNALISPPREQGQEQVQSRNLEHHEEEPELGVEEEESSPVSVFLDKTRKKVKLQEKIILSHDTRLFRFALPQKNSVLGLPIGKHIKFWCPNPRPVVEGEWNCRIDPEAGRDEIERKYTPSSSDRDLGRLDVVIKVYRGNQRFPDGGKMSQYLESLNIGDEIDIAGPFGRIGYLGHGRFVIGRKEYRFPNVGMIAGGTGVTPMLQLIQAILRDPRDETKMSLLFANQTEDDILVRDLLEDEARKHPSRFRVHYTLDRPPANWEYSTGFINEEMIKNHMPPPSEESVILMCGPPPMIKFACKPNLEKLGFCRDRQIEF